MVGQKPDELIRTPMQWAPTEGAGFTEGTPWEPVNRDSTTVNVAAQADDPDSLLSRYRTLIHLRAEHPALAVGAVAPVESTCPDLHAALRTMPDGSDTVLVVHNFSDTPQSGCALAVAGSQLAESALTATDLLTGAAVDPVTVAAGGVITDYVPVPTIRPRQSVLLALTS
jgi:glycosidase